MTTFALIHGGFHGAWCWQALIGELARLGHPGFAVDLPGHGQDGTPRAGIGFDDYVDAAVGFVAGLGGEKPVLVGHSVSGMILPEVAQRLAHRVAQVVYVAAYVLEPGEAQLDLVPPARQQRYRESAARSPDHTLAIDFEAARAAFFSDLPEPAARAYYGLLTPEPLAPLMQPARVDPRSAGTRRHYVVCLQDRALPAQLSASFAARVGGSAHELDAGHDGMLSQPAALARLLDALA
jgi:pimeloyl-ACP methyl ester carboxylesterase